MNTPTTASDLIPLFEVRSYEVFPGTGWKKGKIHAVDVTQGKIFCGKKLSDLEGHRLGGYQSLITCKGCLLAIKKRSEREIEHEHALATLKEREREKEEKDRLWWEAYNAYLSTPTWKTKRQLVLYRSNGLCEGCQRERATQVHHLWYPREGFVTLDPGSDAWIRKEKLFSLVAVCDECHDDIHERLDQAEDAIDEDHDEQQGEDPF